MQPYELKHQLQPAATVLGCLGVGHLARALGLSRATVSNWNRPTNTSSKTQAGTGGYIPREHWPAIVEMAKKEGFKNITLNLLASKPHPQQLPGARYMLQMPRQRNPKAPFVWSPDWIQSKRR